MRAELNVWLTRDRLGTAMFYAEPAYTSNGIWEETRDDSWVDLPFPEFVYPCRIGQRRGELLLKVEQAEFGISQVGLVDSLDAVKRAHVLEVLRNHGGNKTRAASALGINVKTLYNNLEKWGILP